MFAGTLIGLVSENQHFQLVMRAGFRLKSILVAQVQRKVLSLTPAARSKFSSGRIYSLVSSDAGAQGMTTDCMAGHGLHAPPSALRRLPRSTSRAVSSRLGPAA